MLPLLVNHPQNVGSHWELWQVDHPVYHLTWSIVHEEQTRSYPGRSDRLEQALCCPSWKVIVTRAWTPAEVIILEEYRFVPWSSQEREGHLSALGGTLPHPLRQLTYLSSDGKVSRGENSRKSGQWALTSKTNSQSVGAEQSESCPWLFEMLAKNSSLTTAGQKMSGSSSCAGPGVETCMYCFIYC